MNPWPTKNLGEVCEFVFGCSFKADDFNEQCKGLPVIRIGDIDKGITEKFYDKEYDDKYLVEKGDILIGLSGSIKIDKWKGEKALLNQRIVKVCNFKHEILKDFVFYQLPSILKRLEIQIAQGTVKNVLLPHLSNLKILVPPLKIQQKIVERLDEIRKVQELNDKQIELAEELFQSLLHRELDPKGKNWEVRKIKECLRSCQYGISLKMNSQKIGYPILRINNLSNGEIDTSDIKYVEINREEFEKYKLEKGDILFNRVNSYDLVGKTSIFNLEDNYVFASYLIRLKTNSKLLLGEFLNYFLNSNPGQRAIKSKARRAVSQANVNARELESIKIPLPPLETQQKIVEKLSAVQEYKKKLLERKQKLQELFESVLDKSFKGELEE